MQQKFLKNAGIALIIGAVLLTVTMGLHPVGGSFSHLLKIIPLIIGTHALAIVSILILFFGFYGLTKKLSSTYSLSLAAFISIAVALLAGIIAAALNGLALPLFILQYQNATEAVIETIRPVLNYNKSLNHAFDFILIGGIIIAIFLYSLAILKDQTFPKWFAYFGFLISALFIILLCIGFALVDLGGFRIFIFSIVIWKFLAGYLLYKKT